MRVRLMQADPPHTPGVWRIVMAAGSSSAIDMAETCLASSMASFNTASSLDAVSASNALIVSSTSRASGLITTIMVSQYRSCICKLVGCSVPGRHFYPAMTSPLTLLKAFVLLLALVCLPVAVGMLACGVTWTGLVLGLAVGMVGIGPLLGCIGDERCSTRQAWLGKGLLG